MEKLKGRTRLTVLILAFLGFVIAGFALSKWLPLSCLLIFLQGVAIMASASLMLSLVQLIATDAMRGRVMSVYNLAFRAGIPLGSLVLGKLIPIFGVSTALSGAGFMLVAVSLISCWQRDSSSEAARTLRDIPAPERNRRSLRYAPVGMTILLVHLTLLYLVVPTGA